MNTKQFLITLNLIGLVILGLRTNPNPVIAQINPLAPVGKVNQSPRTPPLHKMQLQVKRVEDILVAEGQPVSAGQTIADQSSERARLNLQKEQLELTLNQLKESKIELPTKPEEVPPLTPLPDISYQQYEASIEKADGKIKAVERKIDLKKRQIDFLKSQPGIDAAILEHESNALNLIQEELDEAIADLALAEGRLQTAKSERANLEYQHQLNLARRIEEQNTARSFYEQKLLQVREQERERDYRISQINLDIQGIEDKIASLSVVRSPYAGTIRRIKNTGQSGNIINFELSILTSSGGGTGTPGAGN